MQPKSAPATDREIRNVLGSSSEEIIAAIRGTGASHQEVLQAFTWLENDDYMGKTKHKTMSDKIRQVYDILVEDRDEQDPDRS